MTTATEPTYGFRTNTLFEDLRRAGKDVSIAEVDNAIDLAVNDLQNETGNGRPNPDNEYTWHRELQSAVFALLEIDEDEVYDVEGVVTSDAPAPFGGI